MLSLEHLGWNQELSAQAEPGTDSRPARVVADFGATLAVHDGASESIALQLPLRGETRATVGDWVLVRPGGPEGRETIERLLPRRSALLRGSAGRRTEVQVMAANVDVAFVVMGLDGDFNCRRLERCVAAVWESGARPVVILNKADLVENPDPYVREAAAVAPGVAVHATSAREMAGVAVVAVELSGHRTGVLVGSSGVGKSTIVNHLLGEERQSTRPVRDDDSRGRHTTTARRLFVIPSGGLLIDGPGIRELQLWDAETGVDRTFSDIEILARECRYRDCCHTGEPGCEVRRAVDEGRLDGARLASFLKLREELAWLERRRDGAARREEARRWRTIHREMRRIPNPKRGPR